MRRTLLLTLSLAALCAAPANAAVTLLAKGVLGGTSDLSGLAGNLESGIAANVLGGLGSGLTYAGGNTFLAVPDRGPNANPYNSNVDDTTSYISRFHTLTLALTATPGGALPFALTPTLTNTTLLSSPTALTYGSGTALGLSPGAPVQNDATHFYFSGRSDNFGAGASTNPANARFDPEGVRVSNDGLTVFVSDEYGPYVRQFNRATGQLVRTFALPANLDVAVLSAKGDNEMKPFNASGRVANKGMEGLAITPDGKTLVGVMQAPLIQDAAVNATKNMIRLVTIDIATGDTKEYGYMLTSGSGVSEIVAINDHEFLLDERDGKGLGDGTQAAVKQFFKINTTSATDIKGLNGAAAAAAAIVKTPTPFVDLVTLLLANGFTKATIPAKIEGLAFGQDVLVGGVNTHTLFVVNDNDFLPTVGGLANPNQFFVVGFTDADLADFQQQQFAAAVPEPASWTLMIAGFGLVGGALRRRGAVVA